jgi:hypothetical protein
LSAARNTGIKISKGTFVSSFLRLVRSLREKGLPLSLPEEEEKPPARNLLF